VKKIQSRDNAATLANNRRIGSSATKKVRCRRSFPNVAGTAQAWRERKLIDDKLRMRLEGWMLASKQRMSSPGLTHPSSAATAAHCRGQGPKPLSDTPLIATPLPQLTPAHIACSRGMADWLGNRNICAIV
jgi:hypothetical protein